MSYKKVFLLFAISLVLFQTQSFQASAKSSVVSEERVDQVEKYVEKQFQRAGIVGGAYAIISRDQLVATNGIGYSDLKLKKRATPETIYPIASVTKPITATAILQLQEQGKLDINDPVQKYLPWFTYKNKEKSKAITIEQLLTHSVGINRYQADGTIFIDEKENRSSLEKSVRALKIVEITSEPGSKGQYCNSCYNTLGLIIEKVSGLSYYDYMKTFVFEPLGMENTVYGQDLQTIDSKLLAKENSWFLGFRNTKLLNYTSFGKSQDPEGGIYTNVVDLAKYISATLGYSASPILSEETLRSSFIGVVPTEKNSWEYTDGGFELGEVANKSVIYKGGDGIGSTAAIMMVPDEGLGIVLFLGESNSEPKQEIAKGMIQILLGEEAQVSEFPPAFFKLTGLIILTVMIFCLLVLVMLIRSIRKRWFTKNKSIKYRWLRVFSSLCLLLLSVFIGYLLLFVKPTQVGFNGYPYDIAIGLMFLGMTLVITFIYQAYLSVFGQVKQKSKIL